MALKLREIAKRYRELAMGLSNPNDVALTLELAAQLEDIARLEVSDCQTDDNRFTEQACWLQSALFRMFEVPCSSPAELEKMFALLLDNISEQSYLRQPNITETKQRQRRS